MASLVQRDGRWRALVRRKGYTPQCRTFATKAEATAWARRVEAQMDTGEPEVRQGDDLTVADLVQAYRKLRDKARPIRDDSTEHYQLRTLERLLGTYRVTRMTPDDLAGFGAARREEGAGPYTINMDLSKLGTVLRYGAAALRVSLPDVVGSARPLLTHLRLIGGGGRRERRPTDDELQRILEHLQREHGAVYADAVAFAACTAMRRGEVCELRWADLDAATRCATVARKHPRKGKEIHRVPVMGQGWEIAQRQPKVDGDDRVFPVHPQTLSKYFTWACTALSIPDLHFHDLRHEGTSRLFEAGYSVPEVALVTGHKNLGHLTRYTNLRPEDVAARVVVDRRG
jgi:integrase